MMPSIDRIITMVLKLYWTPPAVVRLTIATSIGWITGTARKLYRALPAVVLATFATYALNRIGVLHGLEHQIL